MANLKGAEFRRQVRDAFHRLAKFRESRHNREVKGFVSINRMKQAKTILNKFSNYLTNKGITTGKLNKYMSNVDIVKDFVRDEIFNKDYAPSTVQEYVSLFGKTLENLAHNNINISRESINYVKDLYHTAKETFRSDGYETGRYINNLEDKLDNLYQKNFGSGVLAEVQSSLGLRISEAYELVRNFNNYYNPGAGTIEGLIGKANHLYEPKEIQQDLAYKIEALHNNNSILPSKTNYREDLKEIGINKSHDLRITYAKNLFEQKLEEGKSYREALKEVSIELNHWRSEMTEYYLARA
jgi:hypothetical protein